MKITVEIINGQTHEFEVDDNVTVKAVKAMIEEKDGIPAKSQWLLLHGQIMEDGKKLADYGIVDGSVFQAMFRL